MRIQKGGLYLNIGDLFANFGDLWGRFGVIYRHFSGMRLSALELFAFIRPSEVYFRVSLICCVGNRKKSMRETLVFRNVFDNEYK